MLLMVFTGLSYAQIVSTSTGGNWSNPKTWVGGVVPTANADVVINGTVKHSSKKDVCRNLTINQGAVLTLLSPNTNGGGAIKIYGNLINNGTICNSDAGGWLHLSIYKDFVNNGKCTNYSIAFMGNSDQTISGTQPFAPYFIMMQNDNKLIASTDISFLGTTLLFYQKNKMVISEGKTVSLSFSSLHKRTTAFMPPDNTAQNVHFTGKGKVLADEKYKFDRCAFDGVLLKRN